MTKRNINQTRRRLLNRDETDQVYVDGDYTDTEAIFRTVIDYEQVDDFEDFVDDELVVDIQKMKNVGIGTEVVLR